MNFEYNDEQTMLRDSLARFLEQQYGFDRRQRLIAEDGPYDAATWRQLGEFGLLALPFPEAMGGLGGSIVDNVAVAELFGRHLLVEPWLSSILLAGGALVEAGAEEEAARLISGETLGAFAYEEGAGTGDPAWMAVKASAVDGGYALSGEKKMVLGGADADWLIVAARTGEGGLCLLRVDRGAAGVSVAPYRTIDGRKAANIRFDDVRLDASALLLADAEAAIRRVVETAMVVLAAEAVGAMGVLLESSAAYAGTRQQFGVPIGSFQAIAHRLADMKMAYVKARSTLLYTSAMVEAGTAAPRDISLLKAQVGRLGRLIGESAVQIHGGVGMTDELAVGHYFKRILAVEAMFGSTDHHLRVVGTTERSSVRG